LTNLISNANRYTQAGGSITVKIIQEADKLKISVADNGPGVEVREQELIFERFYRATSNQSSKTGTGLGLSIARSLVELHSGRIWVESKPGQGSTFYFTLPTHSLAIYPEQKQLTATRTGTN
jgi:signal transduction histidine kinase